MTVPTAVTTKVLRPDLGYKAAVLKYTKAAAGDYITLTAAAETARGTTGVTYKYGIFMDTILFAVATKDVGGVSDPCTFASGIVTLTAGTLAGTALVIGV